MLLSRCRPFLFSVISSIWRRYLYLRLCAMHANCNRQGSYLFSGCLNLLNVYYWNLTPDNINLTLDWATQLADHSEQCFPKVAVTYSPGVLTRVHHRARTHTPHQMQFQVFILKVPAQILMLQKQFSARSWQQLFAVMKLLFAWL